MPKVLIEFNEDDLESAQMALNVMAYWAVISNFKEVLRQKNKYHPDDMTDREAALVEELYQTLCNLLSDEGLLHQF